MKNERWLGKALVLIISILLDKSYNDVHHRQFNSLIKEFEEDTPLPEGLNK